MSKYPPLHAVHFTIVINKVLSHVIYTYYSFCTDTFLTFRYIEVNVRSSSAYRRYNAEVPPFLHNRPPDIVRHVMSRMESSLSERHVSPLTEGYFLVKSEIQEGKAYTVHFGTDAIFPSCQCNDWKRHKLPCKHFCAIFKHIPGWTWHQMSKRYIGHPLLNLDSMHQTTSQLSGNTEIQSQTITCVGK